MSTYCLASHGLHSMALFIFSLNKKRRFAIISHARVIRLVLFTLRESTTLCLYFEDYLNVFKYIYIKVVVTSLTPPNPWCHRIISHATLFVAVQSAWHLFLFFLILSKPQLILGNSKSRSTGPTQLIFITSYRSCRGCLCQKGFSATVPVYVQLILVTIFQ